MRVVHYTVQYVCTYAITLFNTWCPMLCQNRPIPYYCYALYRLILYLFCSGFRTVTRELVTLAYFSVCLRRSLVTQVLERGEYMCGWPSDAAYNLYLYIKRIIFVPLKSTISNLAFPRPSFWQTSPQTESRWVLQRVSSGWKIWTNA